MAVAALAAAAALLGPRVEALHDDRDASDLEPGLLQVAPDLRGAVSLGNGVYVQLSTGGLVISRQAAVVFRGVDHGSPFTAGTGSLRWRQADGGAVSPGSDDAWAAHDGPRWQVHEDVEHSLGNLSVTGRVLDGRSVTYTGRVFRDAPDGDLSLPFELTITRRALDSRVLLDVRVPGADAVALHEYRRPGYTFRGAGAQRDELLLSDGRYPVVTRSTDVGGDDGSSLAPVPALFSSAGSGWALDTRAYSVVDLRHGGRVDATVWQNRLQARLYDGTPEQMISQHTTDAAQVHPLPVWATAGAVVSVRGSTDRVQDAAVRLLDGGAALAAVLVRDGGDRRTYPGWARLVDRLAAKDVRVLTSVAPGFALRARPSGPDDEPALLTVARNRSYLVEDAEGDPLPVRLPDPDVGSVPGVLLDLTNADAVAWYTQMLADRMRHERVSGWSVLGGAGLPTSARLRSGDAATEHNAWPRRWAAVTRRACELAGRPDCLLLQDTADERTPASAGAFGLGRTATDWSARGLGGVLAATVNAGLSGLATTYSGVGGTTTLRSWTGRARERDDELLARWAELEAFGSLLVTEDGDHPEGTPQVWDSPARLAAFARSSRVFAALADYRRTVLRQAQDDGLPVVRPLWLSEPGLTQSSTGAEFQFGDSLLVVPVVRAGERQVDVALPPGRWVELFTGVQHDVGDPRPVAAASAATATDVATPRQITVDAPVGRPVVLFRAQDRDAVQVRDALVTAGLVPAAPSSGGRNS
ncbi:hypothetical protein GCM10027446_29130 [Angustibacter peucedani]